VLCDSDIKDNMHILLANDWNLELYYTHSMAENILDILQNLNSNQKALFACILNLVNLEVKNLEG
jgi:hypothetical protein